MSESPTTRYYGRRKGRRLRPSVQGLLARTLGRLDLSKALADAAPGSLDPRALFDPMPPTVWLELGFGSGEHLVALASERPEIGFIGVEPYLNGVAACARQIEALKLANVRLLADAAEPLLAALKPASIGRLFLLFSDPWPKARHARRRLIRPDTLAEYARILGPGAELRTATDDPVYLRWALKLLTESSEFEWLARAADDFRRRPPDWPETRYEAKALAAGRKPAFLTFLRRK